MYPQLERRYNISPRTGRPPSTDPKVLNTRIRLSEADIKMLNYCCEFYGLTKAEVIRQGIKGLYEKAQKETPV
jgi:hypothetical protein